MKVPGERSTDQALDRHVLALLQLHRRLTFLALADLLPLYSWRALFAALNRLLRTGHVALAPLGEDYEVVLLRPRGWFTKKNDRSVPGEDSIA